MIWYSWVKITHRYNADDYKVSITWAHANNFHSTTYIWKYLLHTGGPILKWKAGIFFCLCDGSHQANILVKDRSCLHWYELKLAANILAKDRSCLYWYELKLARTQLENAPLIFPGGCWHWHKTRVQTYLDRHSSPHVVDLKHHYKHHYSTLLELQGCEE